MVIPLVLDPSGEIKTNQHARVAILPLRKSQPGFEPLIGIKAFHHNLLLEGLINTQLNNPYHHCGTRKSRIECL